MEQINISLCPHCYCMTKNIKISRANHICGKCGKSKNLQKEKQLIELLYSGEKY